MADDEPKRREATGGPDVARRPAGPPPSGNRGIVGVLFVVVLVVLAGYLINRMTFYASLGDCAFTHAPQCRALLH